MRERAVPGDELDRPAGGVDHGRRHGDRVDRLQVTCAVQRDRVPAHVVGAREGRKRLRAVGAGDPHVGRQLEVPQRPAQVRICVDEDAVRARLREDDRLSDGPVRPDLRMPVDDHGEVFAHDDQVDARVRPRAALVVDERGSGGLVDRERDDGRLARPDGGRRLEAGELVRGSGADLRGRRTGRRGRAARREEHGRGGEEEAPHAEEDSDVAEAAIS